MGVWSLSWYLRTRRESQSHPQLILGTFAFHPPELWALRMSWSEFLLMQQNTMTKKQVGEERIYLTYTSALLFITEGSQDRNSSRAGSWRQELMQRLWRGAAYRLAPRGLVSLLS